MPTQSLDGCIHGGFPSRYPPCPKLDDAALAIGRTGTFQCASQMCGELSSGNQILHLVKMTAIFFLNHAE